MKMLRRFVLRALVVATLAQPALADQPVVNFQLDNSTDFRAYEESLPEGAVPEAPVVDMQPSMPAPIKPITPAVRSPEKPLAKPVTAVVKQPIAPREIPLIETQNDQMVNPEVRYVTGGVGEDEARDIIASKADYNLHIMSANEMGSFVGDARVVIGRKQGEAVEVVLDVVAGPLLYVSLPPGSYTFSATLGSQTKREAFVVKDKGAVRNIHLGWKSVRAIKQ